MEYVYAAIFTDNTVKFGRSTDVWSRLYAYNAESVRHQNRLVACFISTVFDSVDVERELIKCAVNLGMDMTSREGFSYNKLTDVRDVFRTIRLPYIFCEMSRDGFGPVLAKNSFSTDFDKVDLEFSSNDVSRQSRIEARVVNLVKTYSGPVTPSILRNRLLNYPIEEVMSVVDAMVKKNTVIRQDYIIRGENVGRLVMP